MRFDKLSPKQAEIFTFPHEDYDALICDGAVRTGKTLMMVNSYIMWAMAEFDGQTFAICGKTVQSTERNIITPLTSIKSVTERFSITYARATHLMTVKCKGRINYFYIFGGRDESSYTLIQGITLAGVLFDEVALMPRSFVEQAITRTLTIEKRKLWFNCNPEHPGHWFYKEWICKPEAHNAKYLHFELEDNPGFTSEALEKAKSGFVGPFYERYILGRWVTMYGLVYPHFKADKHTFKLEEAPPNGTYYMSCDYGTVNAFSLGLWLVTSSSAYRIAEYYFDSKIEGRQLTDEEYYEQLELLAGDRMIQNVIVDPSAASFIQCIRRHGRFSVYQAINDVLDGIRYTSSFLLSGHLLFCEDCKDSIREFGLYRWDPDSTVDKPIKENDHSMDEIRYFCSTVLVRDLRHQLSAIIKEREGVAG